MAEAKKTKDGVKEIPKIWTVGKPGSGGELRKLKKEHFPKTKAGRVAFCDYRIEVWKAKKAKEEKKGDPVTKLEAKKAKIETKLAEVNKEIEELEGTKA